MALQTSGPISNLDIQNEFGGSAPISLSEYYRGGPYTTSNNTSVPTSGAISLSNFYGATSAITVTYEVIGGGGSGGGGRDTISTSQAGTASSITGSGFSTVSSAGGAGGVDRSLFSSTSGQSSFYGPGGAAGATSDSGNQTAGGDAPATSYGAGGGGGGGFPFSSYNAGGGGFTASRVASSQNLLPGTSLTVTVGAKGVYPSTVGTEGGDGANGYVKITVNGVSTEYTTPGTYTYTVPS